MVDLGLGLHIKQLQLEIPFKEELVKDCIEKRFPYLTVVGVTSTEITCSNGLIWTYRIVDRNDWLKKVPV